MRRFVYIFLPLMLSACATDTMKDGLPYLVGKPIQNAINYLGYPDDQKTIAGQDIYIWHYEKTFTTTQTVYTPYSGTAYGMGGGMSYSGQASSVVPEVHNNYCNIRLIADKKGIVRHFDGEGNNGGCRHYADSVERIIEDAQKTKLSVDSSDDLKKSKK